MDDGVLREEEEEDGVEEQKVHRRNQGASQAEPDHTGKQSRLLIACSVLGLVWFIVSLILLAYFNAGWYKTCQSELDICSAELSDESRSSILKGGDYKTCINSLNTCSTELSKVQEDVKTCNSERARLYHKEGECKTCQNDLERYKELLKYSDEEKNSRIDENSDLKSELASCKTGRSHDYILIAIPLLLLCCCFGAASRPSQRMNRMIRY